MEQITLNKNRGKMSNNLTLKGQISKRPKKKITEMTKTDKALIKRAERNISKMANFEVWSSNLKYWPDIQEIVKSSGLTPKKFHDKLRQDFLDLIEMVKNKYEQ